MSTFCNKPKILTRPEIPCVCGLTRERADRASQAQLLSNSRLHWHLILKTRSLPVSVIDAFLYGDIVCLHTRPSDRLGVVLWIFVLVKFRKLDSEKPIEQVKTGDYLISWQISGQKDILISSFSSLILTRWSVKGYGKKSRSFLNPSTTCSI